MDRDGDVERLFSWLQTPDLRYREFAGEREVSDATANWPALRQAASTTADSALPADVPAPPAPEHPASAPGSPQAASPRGGLAARLREAMGRLPPLSEDQSRFTDIGNTVSNPALPPALSQRPARIAEPPAGTDDVHRRPFDLHAAAPDQPPPGRRPILGTVPPPQPAPPADAAETPGGMFTGTYRGFEEGPGEPAPAPAASDPSEHPRSLDAVFSRLARPGRPHRELRGRSASQSGLGPVFRRLR